MLLTKTKKITKKSNEFNDFCLVRVGGHIWPWTNKVQLYVAYICSIAIIYFNTQIYVLCLGKTIVWC